ncbi:MAG: YggU family protein [Proteobacteria bacterium]|nr:YggU family protein [Pseudomonadota bacterium]
MTFYHYQKTDLILMLYVQPNAKQDKVVGLFNNQYLKVQIKAPAVDNKANAYLQKWLADEFQVAKNQVLLVKGEHSRQKTFSIKAPKSMPDWIKNN